MENVSVRSKLLNFDKDKPLHIESNLIVNTYDIDVAGHVNNIVYVRWLEDLRNILFSHVYSLEKLLSNNYYVFVVATEMKYKKQIKLFDKPVGKMTLINYTHGMYTLKAEVTINNHIHFNAVQKCVLVDLKENKMIIDDIKL